MKVTQTQLEQELIQAAEALDYNKIGHLLSQGVNPNLKYNTGESVIFTTTKNYVKSRDTQHVTEFIKITNSFMYYGVDPQFLRSYIFTDPYMNNPLQYQLDQRAESEVIIKTLRRNSHSNAVCRAMFMSALKAERLDYAKEIVAKQGNALEFLTEKAVIKQLIACIKRDNGKTPNTDLLVLCQAANSTYEPWLCFGLREKRQLRELVTRFSNPVEAAKQTALNTAFRKCAERGETDIGAALLEAGVNINFQDQHGKTPLMHALEVLTQTKETNATLAKAITEFIRFMLNTNKVDVNLAAQDGTTALHLANQGGLGDMIKLLEDRRAKLAVDKSGKLPADYSNSQAMRETSLEERKERKEGQGGDRSPTHFREQVLQRRSVVSSLNLDS